MPPRTAPGQDASPRVWPLCGGPTTEAWPGKPETFAWLGLTHRCGQTQRGVGTVRRRRWPIQALGAWLKRVVVGQYRSYGVPRHMGMLRVFRERIRRDGGRPIRRRRQRHRMTWQRMDQHATQGLPDPHILHPYPAQRLRVTTPGSSPVRSCRTLGSVRGVPGHQHPYRGHISNWGEPQFDLR